MKGDSIMYENYTRQSLPSKEYRELLGSAICVFNSNNSFIIENILRYDSTNTYSWHQLIDLESGKLFKLIKETITKNSNTQIAMLFEDIIAKRNRIIHSFQITYQGNQILATKDKNNNQFIITSKYLLDFISQNEELSTKLHTFR